jgi:hypothetical protein
MAVEKTGAVFTITAEVAELLACAQPRTASQSPKRTWEEAQPFSRFPNLFLNIQP